MNAFRSFSVCSIRRAGNVAILLCMLVMARPSLADCDAIVEKLSIDLKYSWNAGDERKNFNACKVLPTDKNFSVVVFANPTLTDDLEEQFFDIDLLLVRNDNSTIFKRKFQKKQLISNAVALNGIGIEVGKYQLTSQIRAIGIGAYFSSNSHSYSFNAHTINLYVAEGKIIKSVLKNLILAQESSSGDFEFKTPDDHCTGTITKIYRTVSIGKIRSNGYADLLITEKRINSDSEPGRGDDCKTTSSKSSKQYTLRFNGNAYVVPKELLYE